MKADQPSPCLPAVRGPGGPVPLRRPGSVRRTSSIDLHWPDGRAGEALFDGRARDVLTRADGQSRVVDQSFAAGKSSLQRHLSDVRLGTDKQLSPQFEGLRAGGELRAKLREWFVEPQQRASTLFHLLDDLAGATLVSTWSWFAWEGYSKTLADTLRGAGISGNKGNMSGICIGLRQDSNALDAKGFPKIETQQSLPVPSLINPDDANGWHDLPSIAGPSMRRARWIDLYRDGRTLVAETGFQDSGAQKAGGRLAVHEYRATIVIDGNDQRIQSIDARAHVLPHVECPAAVGNLDCILGLKIEEVQDKVPQRLAKERGCTHLNDLLRSIYGVQDMARHLPN